MMRLIRPSRFGIIDWRNLAVLMGAPGFEGLVEQPLRLAEYVGADVIDLKSHLRLTQSIYQNYNDTLRRLAEQHKLSVANLDLVLWTYSIQRQPFAYSAAPAARNAFAIDAQTRTMLREDHKAAAKLMVDGYLGQMKDVGQLSRERVADEVRSIFSFVRSECLQFGRGKRGKLRDKVTQVTRALDLAIANKNDYRLLAQWSRWQQLVDTTSPGWVGISLPTEMILEGHMILEDFLPVREYLEEFYDSGTLQPKSAD